jgi:AcrR family transcriptional regulator
MSTQTETPMTDSVAQNGRVAQRRRTRRAIVEATTGLLATGADPSIPDIAAAADVSPRTIYSYFPSLDQLVLDASAGAINAGVDEALATTTETNPRKRIEVMLDAMFATIDQSLPLGRKLIKLTVDAPLREQTPPRGQRRIEWLEAAASPLRTQLGAARFHRLISALALVVGWDAFVVLFDVRRLPKNQARQICLSAAIALIDAAVTDADASRQTGSR